MRTLHRFSRLLPVVLVTGIVSSLSVVFGGDSEAWACSPPQRLWCPSNEFQKDQVLFENYYGSSGSVQYEGFPLQDACKTKPELQSLLKYLPTIDLAKTREDKQGPSKSSVAMVTVSRPKQTQFDGVEDQSSACRGLTVNDENIDIDTRACVEFSLASDTLTPAPRLGYFLRIFDHNVPSKNVSWDTSPALSTTGKECIQINYMNKKSGTGSYVENHPEPYHFTVQVVVVDGSGNETMSDPYPFQETKSSGGVSEEGGSLGDGTLGGAAGANATQPGNRAGSCSYGLVSPGHSGTNEVMVLSGLIMLWIRGRDRRRLVVPSALI